MSILSFFAAPFNKIIDSVGDAIDKNVTSEEERLKLKNEMLAIKATTDLELQKLELQYEQELSKRHEMDMKSDDKWSKRIRPMSLAYLLLVVTILALSDGNISWNEYEFVIRENYIDLFQTLLIVAFGFYFGSRGFEKVHAIKYGKPTDGK